LEKRKAALDPSAVWAAIKEKVASRSAVVSALATVEQLVPEDDGSAETALRTALGARYNTVRPFLRLLGESSALSAAPRGRRVLDAVRTLPALARRRVGQRRLLPGDIDQDLVPPVWRPAVYANASLPEGSVDRDAYVVCVLEQLFQALNRRDVFASPSQRWSDPRARLLDGPRWEAVRQDVLAGLSLQVPVSEHLASLSRGLDAAWRQMAERLDDAPLQGLDLLIESPQHRDRGAGRGRVGRGEHLGLAPLLIA
jgi:hypothetical protein